MKVFPQVNWTKIQQKLNEAIDEVKTVTEYPDRRRQKARPELLMQHTQIFDTDESISYVASRP